MNQQPVIDFAAARSRIEALAEQVIEIEPAVEIEFSPHATLIERMHVVHGESLAEVIAIAIEESK